MTSSRTRQRIIKFGKASAITAVAFLLSWFMVYDFTSLSYFAPLEKASDFIASDFYTMVAGGLTVKEYDDRVAVVSVDGFTRAELSETFRAMSHAKPGVVAVDIMFEKRGDSTDIEIAESLSSLPAVVFPVALNFDERNASPSPSVYDYIDNGVPGVVNLDINSQRNIARTFKPIFVQSGAERESMAYAAVKELLGKAPAMDATPGESMDINFTTMEFDCYSAQDVMENPGMVAGKLIFVGDMDNPADMHSTPLDEYTPGVMIHAYSASTLISGNYIHHVPRELIWILSACLSVLFIYAQLSLCDSKSGNMIMRWLQAGILLMLIFIGSILYVEKRINLDLSMPLTMIALGLLACDLWMMMETIPEWPRWISDRWKGLRKLIVRK